MRLTYHADYALRLLLYLGLKPGQVVTVGEVSDAYGISRNHLIKVAQALGRLGYVDILRGKTGGLRLAQAPEAINIGAVVRQTEPSFELLECFDPATNTCPIISACLLKRILKEAQTAFLSTLERYTMADVLKRPEMLSSILLVRRKRNGASLAAP